MSKLEKALTRIASIPKDYTYEEAKALLKQLGFEEIQKGNTSGSRVKFFRKTDNDVILLHKSRPKKEMKPRVIRQLKLHLQQIGELK